MEVKLLSLIRANVCKIGKLGRLNSKYIEHIINNTNFQTMNIDTIVNIDFEQIKKKCWLWSGTVGDKVNKGHQHGNMNYDGKLVYVHRLMFHNYIQDVPIYVHTKGEPRLLILHKCSHENNGKCINPWHLYLGTPKGNMQDALKDGTKNKAPSGEKNYNATAKDTTVIKALELLKSGFSQYDVAKLCKVNQSQISRWSRKITRANPIVEQPVDAKPIDTQPVIEQPVQESQLIKQPKKPKKILVKKKKPKSKKVQLEDNN